MTEVPSTTSASQLTTYAACGRRYFYRYVMRSVPEFRSVNFALASAARSTVGWWFHQKLKGRQPTVNAALEVFSADFAADTVPFPVRWKNQTPRGVQGIAQERVRMYLSVHGELPVVAVDQCYEVALRDLETGETLLRPLVGYFDLVLRGRNGFVHVKTMSRALPPRSVRWQLQLGSYVTGVHALRQGAVHIATHAMLKPSVPRIEEYPRMDLKKARRWFFTTARDIEEAIHLGQFPASPGPKCVDCEFEKRCHSELSIDVHLRHANVSRCSRSGGRTSTQAA
jgi:hypothetical protein